MQYQSLHKFILNSITERDNVMECFCWRRTVNGEPSILVFIQALAYFHFDIMSRISTNNLSYFRKTFELLIFRFLMLLFVLICSTIYDQTKNILYPYYLENP